MANENLETIDDFIEKAKNLSTSDSPLDENIVFPVAALLSRGFITSSSCGGHLSRKTGGPYINIEFPKYKDFMRVQAEIVDDETKQKHQHTVDHQISLIELELIKHLNEFYSGRDVLYEDMLVVVRLENNLLQLRSVVNNVIDTLANEEKRKKWLIAVNKEFFDFGTYLFKNLG